MIKKDVKKTTVYYSIHSNEDGTIDIQWWNQKWKAEEDQEARNDKIDQTRIGMVQTYIDSKIHKLAKANKTGHEVMEDIADMFCPDSDDPMGDFNRMSQDNDIPGFRD